MTGLPKSSRKRGDKEKTMNFTQLFDALKKLRKEREYSNTSSFTKEMWRRFTQLCHPDRHENSAAANEATRWLLENRP